MKAFRTAGILSVILLFISAFLPWVYINSGDLHHATLTGMDTGTSVYGKPALMGLIFALLYLITIFLHKVWIKVAGVFFGVVVIAWAIRNYTLFQCALNYCPDKKIGLYLTMLAALGIMVAALVPYMPDKYRKS